MSETELKSGHKYIIIIHTIYDTYCINTRLYKGGETDYTQDNECIFDKAL